MIKEDISIKTEDGKDKDHYEKLLSYLREYRQKFLLTEITRNGKIYVGVEIFCPREAIDESYLHINSLLAGMGYSVWTNKNSETITIR